jgi:hypothetical protein
MTEANVDGATASLAGLTTGNGSSVTGAPSRGGVSGSSLRGASTADSAGSLGRAVARGGMRDTPQQVFRTRPVDLECKKGTDGVMIPLTSNYFALQQRPNWTLLQYRFG